MKAGILGAGSWGTALAIHLAGRDCEVKLWDGDRKLIGKLRRKRVNERYIPEVRIPGEVGLVDRSAEAAEGMDILIVVVPSHAVREVAEQIKDSAGDAVIVSAAKGLERDTLMRMSEVIEDVLGRDRKLVVLSGPSHAEEVSRAIPTAIVSASRDEAAAGLVQDVFMSDSLRVYTNRDVVGVELGGALKNPVAIAAGIADGLSFGDNAKAAILTRGLAEITRLGVKMGANAKTFAGLAGMGDLVTTCISRYSRNRNLGELVGSGKPLKDALQEIGQVAEGVGTARSALELARRHGVEVPITEEVCAVLFEGKSPREAVEELMMRRAKEEG